MSELIIFLKLDQDIAMSPWAREYGYNDRGMISMPIQPTWCNQDKETSIKICTYSPTWNPAGPSWQLQRTHRLHPFLRNSLFSVGFERLLTPGKRPILDNKPKPRQICIQTFFYFMPCMRMKRTHGCVGLVYWYIPNIGIPFESQQWGLHFPNIHSSQTGLRIVQGNIEGITSSDFSWKTIATALSQDSLSIKICTFELWLISISLLHTNEITRNSFYLERTQRVFFFYTSISSLVEEFLLTVSDSLLSSLVSSLSSSTSSGSPVCSARAVYFPLRKAMSSGRLFNAAERIWRFENVAKILAFPSWYLKKYATRTSMAKVTKTTKDPKVVKAFPPVKREETPKKYPGTRKNILYQKRLMTKLVSELQWHNLLAILWGLTQ